MSNIGLSSWLASNVEAHDIRVTFETVASCAIEISAQLRIAAVEGNTKPVGHVNVQGEEQKPLDIISNEIFLTKGAASGVLKAMVSEELDTISIVEKAPASANLALVFDPLDGSSNLDINGNVGSIFSVLSLKGIEATEQNVLQAGTQQCAAGYVLYGPATVLVITTGRNVAMFALDEQAREFILSRENIQIPKETAEYAINASRNSVWYDATRNYINDCTAGANGPLGKKYNMRWCAAMVADVHRILMRGGVFLYPEDTETQTKGGRLRLLYEGNPMSMIVEAAGGAAHTGRASILEVQPTSLHQRISVILGSESEVKTAVGYYK